MHLQGRKFGELAYYFPNGSVFGLVNSARNRCLINPISETEVEEGDQLIMMRPTSIASKGYRPLTNPVKVDIGENATDSQVWLVATAASSPNSLDFARNVMLTCCIVAHQVTDKQQQLSNCCLSAH